MMTNPHGGATNESARAITFSVEVGDLAAAQRLHQFALLLRWRTALSAAVLGVLGAFFAAGLAPGWAYGIVAAASGAAGLSVGAVLILAITPLAARRTLRVQRSLDGAFTVTWSEAGTDTHMARGRTTMAWSDYARWREDGRVILLYHSDAMFQFLPRRVLNAAQVADMRALAAAAGLKGAGGR